MPGEDGHVLRGSTGWRFALGLFLAVLGLVLAAPCATAQGESTNGTPSEWASLAELARQGGPAAPHRPLQLPADAAAPPLALDPYLHLLAARDRQAAHDLEGAEAELNAALDLDPDLFEAHLFAARLDLTRSPAAACEHLEAAFGILRQRFALQAWSLASLAWGTLVFLLAWVTLLAMACASHRAAPVHHLVAERLRSLIEPRLAGPLDAARDGGHRRALDRRAAARAGASAAG